MTFKLHGWMRRGGGFSFVKSSLVETENKMKHTKMKVNKLAVTVVGGGNSAHVMIPFLSANGHNVNLLTRRPNDWKYNITCDIVRMDNTIKKTVHGHIHRKSSDPNRVIPDADVIILCMPVHSYRSALENLAPYIDKHKEVFVGAIYGQAGFNCMFREIQHEHHLTNVAYFTFGLIPWICRADCYGSHGLNYGGNKVNIVAVHPQEKFQKLYQLFLKDVSRSKFVQAHNFISITMSVDNQIIHPSRCYALWKQYKGRWRSLRDVPYFYRDFDDLSAEILSKVDDEYSLVRTGIRKLFPDRKFPYMMNYMDLEIFSNGSEFKDIKESFRNSPTLGLIKTPTIGLEDGSRMLDINCRFFTDDIPYGLLIVKWIAGELGINTPMINEIIQWSQDLRNEHWLNIEDKSIDLEFCLSHKNITGIPPAYGIATVQESVSLN